MVIYPGISAQCTGFCNFEIESTWFYSSVVLVEGFGYIDNSIVSNGGCFISCPGLKVELFWKVVLVVGVLVANGGSSRNQTKYVLLSSVDTLNITGCSI